MPYHIALAPSPLLAAVLLGARAALFFSAATLLVIFWQAACSYFRQLTLRREIVFSDQLGAGIWLTAAGMFGSELPRIIISVLLNRSFDSFALAGCMTAASLLVIITGYILHFAAWASTVHPLLRRLSLIWTLAMALFAGAMVWMAIWLT